MTCAQYLIVKLVLGLGAGFQIVALAIACLFAFPPLSNAVIVQDLSLVVYPNPIHIYTKATEKTHTA
jgi:hypothetical protein